MSGKSLPEHLKEILERQAEQSPVNSDPELEQIITRLSDLNNTVSQLKSRILRNRIES